MNFKDEMARLAEIAKHQERACRCKDCENQRAITEARYQEELAAKQEYEKKLEAQFNHPFYKRVDDFRYEVKVEALTKAATKYKEPFNPLSWSIQELGKHAMAENYDQGNYIMGLVEKAEFYRLEAEYWRARLIKEVGPDAAEKTKGGIIDKQI